MRPDRPERPDPSDDTSQKDPGWYATVLAHLSGAVFVLDSSGVVRFGSPGVTTRFGYTPEEMRGKPLVDFVQSEDRNAVRRSIGKILPVGEGIAGGTCRFRMLSGANQRVVYHTIEYHMVNLLADPFVEGILFECHDIAERKHRMDLLLDVSPDYIFFKDRESRFTRISRSLAEFYGLDTPDEAIGKSDHDYYPPEDAARFRAVEEEVMRTGQPVGELEEREQTLGGVEKWVSTTKSPIVDSDGTVVGTFGISRNVTARKQAEQRIQSLLNEKDLILKEVHHRIKNDMNLIYSLLSLQAAQTDKEDVRSAIIEASNRISVLSRVYERLYGEENVRTVDLKPFVEQISEDFGAGAMGDTIDLSVVADDARVSTRLSVSVGIILNELVVNAIKYAFAHVAEPVIEVEVIVVGRKELRLVVSDNGGGFPADLLKTRRFGFGLSIVESLAEQHQGSLHVGNRTDKSAGDSAISGARVTVTLCDREG